MLRFIYLFLFSMFLVACVSEEAWEEMVREFAPEEVHNEAERVIELFFAREAIAIKEALVPSLQTTAVENQISVMWSHLPDGDFIEAKLIGLNWRSQVGTQSEKFTDYNFTYQFQFTKGWMRLNLSIREQNKELAVSRMNIQPLEQDLREVHKFSMDNAQPVGIIMIILMIISAAFTFWTCYKAIKMRKELQKPKRWIFFTLVGVCAYSVNWTTMDEGYNLLKAGLFGAAFANQGPYTPMMLTVFFPLGATLFWVFKKTGKLGIKEAER